VDFVGRFERLEEDWRTILERIGIAYRPLPHVNKSPRRGDYRDYYTDEGRDAVARYFAQDLEAWGYTF
jgi:hypothetical protein